MAPPHDSEVDDPDGDDGTDDPDTTATDDDDDAFHQPVGEDARDDEPEDDEPDRDEGAAPRVARRGLDGRTVAICALIAFIAAAATYLGASALTGADDDPDAVRGTLVRAEDAPDVALPRLDGDGEISLSDYVGQPLVVNFWGSWCAPCVEEMPDLQAVHTSLGDEVAFLGVNVNDAPEAARSMAERTGVTYDLVRDADGTLVRALEVTTFPTTVLVDADGVIVDISRRQISAERLCEKVNQSLLNQSLEACG